MKRLQECFCIANAWNHDFSQDFADGVEVLWSNAMKHAGAEALDQLEPLLAKLREFDGLTERKRGVFYLKSSAFIHFHEDPTGLYAHFKDASTWHRLPVNTRGERSALVATLRAKLGS